MKRLLIALGALTIVSTAVSAVEDFRPTGSIKQEIRWYGDKEELDTEGVRLTLAEGGVRFTEKFYIDYRVRDYIQYKSDEGSNTKSIRTRLYYDHGVLGNTQVTSRQRLEVNSTDDYNFFKYSPEFSFANYFTGGDYFSVDTLKVRPAYQYKDDNNANKIAQSASLDFLSVYSFPAVPGDLAVEFNVYAGWLEDSASTDKDGDNISDELAAWVELYVYYAYELGSWNGLDFTAYYEFGLDPLKVFEEDRYNASTNEEYKKDITTYQDFELQASYAVNSSTSIYGAIAAEFANQDTQDRAADFKWQPYAYVGWRTKF